MTHSSSANSPEDRDTRQRILDAAIDVFSQKGYHDARVDDIVDASGTSKGAVYFHFKSKQQIFLAIIDQFALILAERLTEAIVAHDEGIQRVNAALATCLEVFGEYHDLAKIFLIQAAGLGATFEEKRLEIHNTFVMVIKSYLDQAVTGGDVPPVDTEITALAWVGAINEVVIRWVLTGYPEPARSLPALRTVLLRSIGVSDERIQLLEEITRQ